MSRIRIITVFVCLGVGLGLAAQSLWASSPNPGKDFFALFRSGKNTVTKTEGAPDTASAAFYYRIAKSHAEQNDVSRANAYFSLALQRATSGQVSAIAADYAVFLSDTGDLLRAEHMLRQALTQAPNDVALTKMLARCLIRQEKVMEGRRLLLSVSTEAEAKAEIAAVYREQGNTEMLVAVEQKWGTPRSETTRPATVVPRAAVPEPIRPEPTLIAAVPRPAMTLPVPPNAARPSVAHNMSRIPEAEVVTPKIIVPQDNPSKEIANIAAMPIVSPLSKSEFFDTRVPIPVPKSAALPGMIVANELRPAPPVPSPARMPAPSAAPLQPKNLVLMNPVKLAASPLPGLPDGEASESMKPAVVVQPRRHYVVNAGTSAELETLLPVIKPAAATVPVQNTRYTQ